VTLSYNFFILIQGNATVQVGSWSTTNSFFAGLLDEVKLFRGALDPTTVFNLFNSTLPDTFFPNNGPNGRPCVNGAPVDAIPQDNRFTCACDANYTDTNCRNALPWALYTMEQSLNDVIGSSAGSCAPASCPTYRLGVSGFGASFDGINDYISLPGPLLMGLYNTSFTFMAWIRVNSFNPNGDNAILASNGITTAGLSLHCVIRRGLLYFGFYNNDFWLHLFSSYWSMDACRFPLLRFESSSKYRNERCFPNIDW
jgi:hypothetical protein